MPEESGGNGPPGPPRRTKGLEFFGRRAFAEVLHFLDGGGEGEVASGPDVRSAERAQEVNVGGPAADAFESDEHLVRRVVRQILKVAEVEVPADERFGKKPGVKRFLPAETDAQQFGVTELQESLGSQGMDFRFEPIESRFGRCQGNLLLENDVDERGKSRLADPQRRPAIGFHHSR